MKRTIILTFLILLIIVASPIKVVKADSLTDSIEDELSSIDFSEILNIEEYFGETSFDFMSTLNSFIKGEFSFDYNSLGDYFKNLLLSNVKHYIPLLISILSISILYLIVKNIRKENTSDSVSNVLSFIFLLSIFILIYNQLYSVWQVSSELINGISKISQAVTPIMLTLMVASNANASVSLYKPSTIFFCETIIQFFSSIILPLIGLMSLLSIISIIFKVVDLSKFSEFISGTIKWLIGIILTVYGIFMTVQGVVGATYDGITYKIAKYTVSNSIPLIGSLLKDGFDIVVAGSIIIKNSIGITTVFMVIGKILSPVINIAILSLVLKLTASFCTAIGDNETSKICINSSKGITYMSISILVVGLMFFITFLMMIFSANVI